MIDPITDMLNRIRNAQAVFHQTVEIPFSEQKYEIAKILEKEGFIEKAEKKGKTTQKILKIDLKYQKDSLTGSRQLRPVISGLKRISKSGQRIYIRSRDIRPVHGGYGIAIISTSKGLMTNKEARKKKLGGEILCEVW
ncbi:MAG: 30S ribosomal protein S8 [Candidatus Magasanikbacteria bacterium]|nr:30S ribosomal protein S8 [Candidatus Magasanikbacteria bacterium]